MSAAVPRTKNANHGTNEFTQRSQTNAKEEPEASPVIEIAKVAGTNLGSISEHGMTPLMRAACDGLAGTVRALLDREADVNAKRSDGFNALALAAFFGHSQVVWLLLEHGADLSVTGRSQTPPEMWADSRGFLDVGNILREARTTRQEEVENSRTAVIEEPARFPRTAEQEKVQPAGDPAPTVPAVKVIEEDIDSPSSFQTKAVAVEEGTARRSESIAEIVPPESDAQAKQRPAINQKLPAPKTLPEIEDPLPLVVPEFHPGSAFVARINSSRTVLVTLILAILLVFGGIAAFLVPQIRKSLAAGRTDNVQRPTNLTTARDVASGTNVSGTAETPPAATTESTIAPASTDNGVPADTAAESQPPESTYPVRSTEVSGKDSTNVEPTRESESASPTGIGRHFSAATSRSATPARKNRRNPGAVVKQETASEEQPKPAPLSVETSRNGSMVSQPVRSANEEPGTQLPPASIISNKPKSKVIQWP